jgi:hypothetical protein
MSVGMSACSVRATALYLIPVPSTLNGIKWILGLDGNLRQLSTIDTRAGRYILVMVWGDGPVEFNDIQVLEERLPLEQIGWFESPDPILNQAWQIGVDTLYSNMTGASRSLAGTRTMVGRCLCHRSRQSRIIWRCCVVKAWVAIYGSGDYWRSTQGYGSQWGWQPHARLRYVVGAEPKRLCTTDGRYPNP